MAKTPQKAAEETVEKNNEIADKKSIEGPKFSENRKKLQEKLNLHSEFVRMMSWAIGIIGVYFAGQFLWSFKGNMLLKIPFDMVFGTATSPGIPVAMMKAVLPAAFAPAAPFVLIGGIAAFWGYQLAYSYFNENLFSGSKKAEQPAQPEQEQADPNATPKERSVKALTQTKAAPVKALSALSKAPQKAASKPVADRKAAAKQGSGRAIVSAFNNQQRQTRLMTKALKAQEAAKSAPAKAKRAAKK